MDKTHSQGSVRGQSLTTVLIPWSGAPTDRPLTAVFSFSVNRGARFLSHAQLGRVFERACVRARVPVAYSQGFNPHARMSLPLPKSVGLAVTEDVLCIRLAALPDGDPMTTAGHLQQSLQRELSEGLVLTRVILVEGKQTLYPRGVTYRFPIPCPPHRRERIDEVMASDTWPMERTRGEGRAQVKTVDVRPYLEAVAVAPEGVDVCCHITSAGSIRVDELAKLFVIDITDMQAPVTRTKVRWQTRSASP